MISEFFSKRLLPVTFLSRFDFVSISILILLSIYARLLSPNKSLSNKLSPNKSSLTHSSIELSNYSNINLQRINLCCQAKVNIGMFKSLLFHERGMNFREIDFFNSVFTYLAVLNIITFSDLFDIVIVKTLVVVSFTILYLSIGH